MSDNKIIVGVHGIGDQVRYETIQAIAYQFCRYYKVPGAVPLGSFHNSKNCGIVEREYKDGKLYFTEAYWADIARKPESEGYILEESKQWAKSIVTRQQSQADEAKAKNVDYRMVRSVLYEAIDTLRILERLAFITEKAGIFKFDLNRVLTDFLGDVQIVTEFGTYRAEIQERFYTALKKAHELDKEAEIYIVSHSEGTVISFLSLLAAVGDPSNPEFAWIRKVKGFMTLGSPIDKHIILWPELWTACQAAAPGIDKGQIKWRNYYDIGDPVGYDLNTARELLIKHKCEAFQFEDKKYDHGFSRYYLPGEAHVEYWKDKTVFDHFIREAVENGSFEPPKSKIDAWAAGFIIPYAGFYAVTFAAVYFLYKAVHEGINHDAHISAGATAWNVGGIAAILAGMTVMARIPRMTGRTRDYIIGGGVFIASVLLYWRMADGTVKKLIGSTILSCPLMDPLIGPLSQSGKGFLYAMSVPIVALIVVVAVGIVSKKWSSARTIPLNIVGGLSVLGIAFAIAFKGQNNPSLWPLFIGGTMFLYLWWLSILFFDLVFVWHKYIRSSRIMAKMRDMRKSR